MRILTIILFFSLTTYSIVYAQFPASLNAAFTEAGKNQSELKAVLKHYSAHRVDSLKNKAAIFLIQNMEMHQSYRSKAWDDYQAELDTVFSREDRSAELAKVFNELHRKYTVPLNDIDYVSDLQTITAKFLIYNIDKAFEAWKSPYARHLNFDDFCEYILPYRVGEEPLCDWRKEFTENFIPGIYTRIKAKKDSITAKQICDAIKTYPYGTITFFPSELPDYNVHTLSVMRTGNCRQYSLQAVLAGRSLGVPIAYDFTPQWATRSFGHEWNALIVENNKSLSFGIGDWMELGQHEKMIDRIAAKIYRETYAKQSGSLALIHGDEEIPNVFLYPCFKDVTKNYTATTDVPIKLTLPTPTQRKFVYLSVFNNKDWIPVAWAKNENANALFKDVNREIICLPTYYFQGSIIPAAYPVIISKNGNLTTLKPDKTKLRTIILSRKYQTNGCSYLGYAMLSAKFQASNDSTFANAVDLYKISEKPEPCYQIAHLQPKEAYKYFRYLAPRGSHGEVAELEVYEPEGKDKLSGRIIGNNHPSPKYLRANAFDGNPATISKSVEIDNTWIGLVFDTPKKIGKIAYLAPNDDNCVCNGQLYELFYWDNKWISLGKQTGSNETYRLTYNNVPANALLLLRNLTKGQEERIFTYENGQQIWW